MKRSDTNPPPSGLILLHKQPGLTSFDALRGIKRALGSGKAGHTGTLDKFAEGLLLVLTGRALKLSKWFTHCDKQYEGTICFGAETDTLDPEGAVIATAAVPERGKVEQVLSQFRGAIEQAPPAYSAIHIDGERASVLARKGEAPEMQKRPVTIYQLELRSWEPPFAKIFVHCSSGTYIRSLARDIGLAVGSRAYLTALLRTQVAGFKLEDASLGSREWGIGSRGLGARDSGEAGGQGDIRNHNPACSNRDPPSPLPTPHSPLPIEAGGQGDIRSHNPACSNRDPPSPLPTPHSPLPRPYPPLPINKSVFSALGIPCIDVSLADSQKIIQGKPLMHIIGKNPALSGETGNTAALFSQDMLIAVIEKKTPPANHYPLPTTHYSWSYGYVYADN